MIEPWPALDHQGQDGTSYEEHAAEVHRDDPVPELDRRLVELPDARDPSVVEEDVDPSESSQNVARQPLATLGIGHVDGERGGSVGRQQRDRSSRGFGVDIRHRDLGALRRESDSGGPSDARAGTGDQADLASESVGHDPTPRGAVDHAFPFGYAYRSIDADFIVML